MAEGIRFYDAETGGRVQVQLQQTAKGFRVLRQIGYRDPAYTEPFIVPANTETFETDLASIPWFFSWLVPGLGTHLPAVLLHDGLVVGEGEPPTHIGPPVDRKTADRILRDAMGNLGTPKIRRWIMWAGVSLATAWSAMRPRAWWRLLVLVTLGTVLVLGVLATLDLFDAADRTFLPWMGDRPWWVELLLGGLFALLVPAALSLLWGRLWAAGLIAGVLLAFLLHVTAVIFLLYGLYRLAEMVVSRPEGTHGNARRSFLLAVARGRLTSSRPRRR